MGVSAGGASAGLDSSSSKTELPAGTDRRSQQDERIEAPGAIADSNVTLSPEENF